MVFFALFCRWFRLEADRVHHRSVSAGFGFAVCRSGSGFTLLQSYCGENTRWGKDPSGSWDPAHSGVRDKCEHPQPFFFFYVWELVAHSFAGFSQGVRRSVGGLATILGPLWAGGLTENMYIMMGVMMALLVLLMVLQKIPLLYIIVFDWRVREFNSSPSFQLMAFFPHC